MAGQCFLVVTAPVSAHDRITGSLDTRAPYHLLRGPPDLDARVYQAHHPLGGPFFGKPKVGRRVTPAELRAAFDAVFASALDPMLIADDEGRYVDANPAACALLGKSLEQ